MHRIEERAETDQRIHRHERRAEGRHPGARGLVAHPGGDDTAHARALLQPENINPVPRQALRDPQASPVQRMPQVVHPRRRKTVGGITLGPATW